MSVRCQREMRRRDTACECQRTDKMIVGVEQAQNMPRHFVRHYPRADEVEHVASGPARDGSGDGRWRGSGQRAACSKIDADRAGLAVPEGQVTIGHP